MWTSTWTRQDVIAKATSFLRIVVNMRGSAKRMAKLRARLVGAGIGRTLLGYNATRWTAAHRSLERLLELRDHVLPVFEEVVNEPGGSPASKAKMRQSLDDFSEYVTLFLF